MDVAERDGQLMLRSPWSDLRTSFLIGLTCLGAALLVLWAFAREGRLACQRAEGNRVGCEVQQTWLGGVISRVIVDSPQQATVEKLMSGKGVATYRLALVTAQGMVPLTYGFSSVSKAQELAPQFNQFLHDASVKAITLTEPASFRAYLMVLFFGGVGVVLLLTARRDTYTFDRVQNALTFKQVRLTGARLRQESIAKLSTTVRRSKGNKDRFYYCVLLHVDGGRDVEIDWFGSNHAEAQAIAERIQNFVRPGVPVKGPDS